MKFRCNVCMDEPCELILAANELHKIWPDGCIFPNLCGPAEWELIP